MSEESINNLYIFVNGDMCYHRADTKLSRIQAFRKFARLVEEHGMECRVELWIMTPTLDHIVLARYNSEAGIQPRED